MRISIREAFNFAFKAKNAWKAVLILFLLNVLLQCIQFSAQFSSELSVVGIAVLCIVFPILFLFSLGFSIYICSYILEIADNARRSLFEVPELFKDIKKRMLRGLYIYLVNLVYTLPFSMILMGALLAFVLPLFFFRTDQPDSQRTTIYFVTALIAILGVAVLLVVGLVTKFLTNAALYKLLTSNYSIAEAFKFGEVWKTMKRGLAESVSLLLKNLVLGLGYVLAFIILFVPSVLLLIFAQETDSSSGSVLLISSFVLIGIVVLVAMFVETVIDYFVSPHMLGQMFRMWDSKGHNKSQ